MVRRILLGLSVLLGLAAPAAAEQEFDAARALVDLIGQERATFEALAPGHLTRISSSTPRFSLIPSKKPAPAARHTDEVWISKQPAATGGKDWKCLTDTLYFEARGETHEGVLAVAEVILNRVDSPRFPDTVCGVVRQGGERRNRCQFSYNCDGRPEHIGERGTYSQMGKVARVMLDGAPRQLTNGATYYHTTGVNPRWAGKLAQTAQIGAHRFYR